MSRTIIITVTVFQYSAKFVCGKSKVETAGQERVLAPGDYYTAINVHNPTEKHIRFKKKVAVAWPQEKAGPVSDYVDAELGPDEALEIDCADIRGHLGAQHPTEAPDDRFLKGFVVIESHVELDVVAVYTAAGRDGHVATFHTERVPPRLRQEQLELPIFPWPQPRE